MPLTEQELSENFKFACRVYINENGGRETTDKNRNEFGSHGTSIVYWRHSSTQPTHVQLLALQLSDVLEEKQKVEDERCCHCMLKITTTRRDKLTPENGMLIYNTTLNKIQGYANSTWVNLH